ncbi:hypothetical protein EDC96DRAFT_545521 [Choanephora cucurbitarum]|nr:hypothetical protein EDC96DRAFT_545521 [Choanephora cucurbitarum]
MTGLGPNDGSVYQVSDGKKTQVGQRNTRHLINMPTILTELCLMVINGCNLHILRALYTIEAAHLGLQVFSCVMHTCMSCFICCNIRTLMQYRSVASCSILDVMDDQNVMMHKHTGMQNLYTCCL